MSSNYLQLARRSEATGQRVRHYQLMACDEQGHPVGYIRFLHLSKDSPRLRADCTRIEEMILDPNYLGTDVPIRLHGKAVSMAQAYGSARVYTEFAIGLSDEKRKRAMRCLRDLANRENISPQQADKLARAQKRLKTDWLEGTMTFVKELGFAPLGFVLPDSAKASCSPYVRISCLLNDQAKPLPVFAREGYRAVPYTRKGEAAIRVELTAA